MATSRSSRAADALARDLFLGCVKIHILHNADGKGAFGAQLMEDLARMGYEVGPGTIYPTLHKLHQARLLRVQSRNVDGRIRKYYFLTPSGKRMLKDVKGRIRVLVREVLHNR